MDNVEEMDKFLERYNFPNTAALPAPDLRRQRCSDSSGRALLSVAVQPASHESEVCSVASEILISLRMLWRDELSRRFVSKGTRTPEASCLGVGTDL